MNRLLPWGLCGLLLAATGCSPASPNRPSGNRKQSNNQKDAAGGDSSSGGDMGQSSQDTGVHRDLGPIDAGQTIDQGVVDSGTQSPMDAQVPDLAYPDAQVGPPDSGTNPANYLPALMREHLQEALQVAAAEDPAVRLVSIIGFGPRRDGKVPLDDASSYIRRWQYMFRNPTGGRTLTVSWYTPAYPTQNPVLDPRGGNVVAEVPINNIAGLPDSSLVANAHSSSACTPLGNSEQDYILYQVIDGMDVVTVSTGGRIWRATAGLNRVLLNCD